jgi:hypothetical protein
MAEQQAVAHIYYPYKHPHLESNEIDFMPALFDTVCIPELTKCSKIEVQCAPHNVTHERDYFHAIGFNCLGQSYLLQAFGSLALIIHDFFRQVKQ